MDRKAADSDNSSKRKREDELSPGLDKQGKAKFDETADLLDNLLAQKKLKSKLSREGSDKKTIADLEAKIKDLKAEVYDAKELLKQNSEENKSECTKCTGSSSELKRSVAQVEELKRKLKSVKAQQTTTLQEEQAKRQEVEQSLTQRMADLAEIAVENGALVVELRAVKALNSELEEANGELRRQHESMFSISPQQYHQLSEEKNTAESALLKTKTELKQALVESESLSTALADEKRVSSAAAEKIRSHEYEQYAAAEHVALLTTQLTEQYAALTALREADTVASSTIRAVLVEEVRALKNSVRGLTEQRDRFELDYLREREKVQSREAASVPDVSSLHRNISSASINTAASSNTAASTVPAPAAQFQVTFNKPSTSTITSTDPVDDLSVLSEGTFPPKKSNALSVLSQLTTLVAAPSQRVVYKDNSAIEKPAVVPKSYKVIHVGNVHPETSPQHIRSLVEVYGTVVNFMPLGLTSYAAELADADDASLAVYKLNNLEVDYWNIVCRPFHEPSPWATTSTVHETAQVPNKPKPQVKVYVLHHAPIKYRMTQEETAHELSRYGLLREIKKMKNHDIFCGEFYQEEHAIDAVRNFPDINGFEVSCERNFTLLPKIGAPRPVNRERDFDAAPATLERTVILRDPALANNRTTAAALTAKHCQICYDERRFALVCTHNTHACRFSATSRNGSNKGHERVDKPRPRKISTLDSSRSDSDRPARNSSASSAVRPNKDSNRDSHTSDSAPHPEGPVHSLTTSR